MVLLTAVIPLIRKPVEDFCHVFNMTVEITQSRARKISLGSVGWLADPMSKTFARANFPP